LTETVNRQFLQANDALICATTLGGAARFDEFTKDWPPPGHITTTRTIAFNVTGNPALAVPTGFTSAGLPLGMQIVGRAFDERTLLRIGAAYTSATGLAKTRPPLNSHPSGLRTASARRSATDTFSRLPDGKRNI